MVILPRLDGYYQLTPTDGGGCSVGGLGGLVPTRPGEQMAPVGGWNDIMCSSDGID